MVVVGTFIVPGWAGPPFSPTAQLARAIVLTGAHLGLTPPTWVARWSAVGFFFQSPNHMATHNIRVTVLLDGDEYLGLQAMSEDDGLSDSAFMRRLLKLEARRRAMAQVSERTDLDESAEPVHLVRTARGQL
jgi:hypothetical protein